MGRNLGNFHIYSVVDGDTLELKEAPMPDVTTRKSLRLVSIDTEETNVPKSLGPVTEYGKEVKRLAQLWFSERKNEVTVESEGNICTSDYFDRALVYVSAGGTLYQEHAIASGWTPYYMKYGYSEEYHGRFVQAEEKARRDKKGIWSPALQKRPKGDGRPYELLIQWWKMRAEQIKLAKEFKSKNPINLLINGQEYKDVLAKAIKGESAQIFGEIDRPSAKEYSGEGFFVIRTKLHAPFYVYVPHQAKQRDKIIESIEGNFLSNTQALPASLLKPNYIFLQGQLGIYAPYGNQIPEMVVTSLDQLSKTPFMPK